MTTCHSPRSSGRTLPIALSAVIGLALAATPMAAGAEEAVPPVKSQTISGYLRYADGSPAQDLYVAYDNFSCSVSHRDINDPEDSSRYNKPLWVDEKDGSFSFKVYPG